MKKLGRMRWATTLAIALPLGLISHASAQDPLPPPPPGDATAPNARATSDVEVLTRGPIHEAFAREYVQDPQPGIIVPDAPPELLNEVPPDQMPEGDNVVWIPGYWGWDDTRNEFIWISGLWRDLPPDQRWVPGYWTQVADGYQWISGFWAPEQSSEIVYLPPPPASQEIGPNSPPPEEAGYFWIPGCWIYQQADYAWRPGYWAPLSNDWVWTPAYYSWTPNGVIFCDGHWDYRFTDRGVLFAPVYVNRSYRQAYSPSYVLNSGALLINLFVRPQYGHYYFGDYYNQSYSQAGYYPWYSVRSSPGYGYDPLLTYYQAYYQTQGNYNFIDRLSRWNNYYQVNANLRPPTTYAQLQQFARNSNAPQAVVQNTLIATTLQNFTQNQTTNISFRQVNAQQREQYQQFARGMRDLQQQRGSLEIDANASGRVANADRLGQAGRGPGASGAAEGDRNRWKLPKVDRPEVAAANRRGPDLPQRPEPNQVADEANRRGPDAEGRNPPGQQPGRRPDRSDLSSQPDAAGNRPQRPDSAPGNGPNDTAEGIRRASQPGGLTRQPDANADRPNAKTPGSITDPANTGRPNRGPQGNNPAAPGLDNVPGNQPGRSNPANTAPGADTRGRGPNAADRTPRTTPGANPLGNPAGAASEAAQQLPGRGNRGRRDFELPEPPGMNGPAGQNRPNPTPGQGPGQRPGQGASPTQGPAGQPNQSPANRVNQAPATPMPTTAPTPSAAPPANASPAPAPAAAPSPATPGKSGAAQGASKGKGKGKGKDK